jgi:hypothetical protein
VPPSPTAYCVTGFPALSARAERREKLWPSAYAAFRAAAIGRHLVAGDLRDWAPRSYARDDTGRVIYGPPGSLGAMPEVPNMGIEVQPITRGRKGWVYVGQSFHYCTA